MSDPLDIKALDEYLRRGSEVSQRYRELGADEVPPELDRLVLAAARDAVAGDKARRSRSWVRWSAPVALAASVVLALTVVLERGGHDEAALLQQSPRDVRGDRGDVSAVRGDAAAEESTTSATDAAKAAKAAEEFVKQPGFVPEVPVAEPPRPAAPPPRPAAEPPRAVQAPPAETAVEAEAATQVESDNAAQVESQNATQALAPVERVTARKPLERTEAQQAESLQLDEVAVTGTSRPRRATVRTAGPRGTVSTTTFGVAPPAADEPRGQADPQAWLEDIRAMRRAGKTAEADREWQRFREAFPDFQVADDDIARQQP